MFDVEPRLVGRRPDPCARCAHHFAVVVRYIVRLPRACCRGSRACRSQRYPVEHKFERSFEARKRAKICNGRQTGCCERYAGNSATSDCASDESTSSTDPTHVNTKQDVVEQAQHGLCIIHGTEHERGLLLPGKRDKGCALAGGVKRAGVTVECEVCSSRLSIGRTAQYATARKCARGQDTNRNVYSGSVCAASALACTNR